MASPARASPAPIEVVLASPALIKRAKPIALPPLRVGGGHLGTAWASKAKLISTEPSDDRSDSKPQNILMDDNWTAKISDFGLAKLLMPSQTRTFTGIRGTRGYLAPEWHKNAPITVKADVYSFGIVLLEIVCCRKNMELEVEEDAIILLDWVHHCFMDGELEKLVPDEVDMTELNRLVKVGLWCTQSEPGSRPSMKNVVMMLEGNVDISLPPPPGFSS
ncbi:hypothetical protein COCNU_15G001370 [Cocos nucifera]|uniref:Protein kinase domain-containing protein n=1 Tax=Cocos nucifera TaxID=13894 RepID=A0A8K0IWW7_COCNU|nr:hypothetical protein COCNU_15G001370 [Cocos nucifera]